MSTADHSNDPRRLMMLVFGKYVAIRPQSFGGQTSLGRTTAGLTASFVT